MSENEHRLIAERRAKLAELRERGSAFPNDFRPTDLAADLHQRCRDQDKAELEASGQTVSVAGRLMAKRVMGKLSFAQIQDRSGRIQLVVQRDALPEGAYAEFKGWDIGDILGATGTMYRTDKGELSVKVDRLRLLTKSLRPLPEKFHGLTDQEMRYRQRYVDLIVNPEVRETFAARSRIV